MGSIQPSQKHGEGARNSSSWQDLVARKRVDNKEKTPSDWLLNDDLLHSVDAGPSKRTNVLNLDVPKRSGLLSLRELDITDNYSATKLLTKLAQGEFTAIEVTTAFCKRAAIAQQLLSCLTEVFYAEALKRASFLDEYYRSVGKPIGPLHGLPISVKDSFCIEGIQSTVGWASFLEHEPSKLNSALIQMLLDMGAVLYVKTNIPQTMMTGDSENNVFGRTLNPHNTSLTAGGSSGGEGALVAFRGSVLGVGTDIAGSIRIPALCCGLYGFKPTAQRIPFGGQVSGAMEGLPGPVPSAGPLAHSLDDIELFLKTILNGRASDYDSSAFAVPWQSNSYPTNKKLRIGVLPEEKVFPLHPPVRRALDDAVEALSKAGHKIIHLSENAECTISFGNRLTFAYYIMGPDPSDSHFGPDGEPQIASVAARSNPLFSGPLPVPFEMEPFEKINALHQQKSRYSEAWRKQWVENRLDVLLAPGAQNTAVPHDTFGWPPYTQVWNILDYPACVVPFGVASKMKDARADPNDGFGPQPQYDAEAVDGAPCAIQIITRRFEDEQCLAAARIIDGVLKGFEQ